MAPEDQATRPIFRKQMILAFIALTEKSDAFAKHLETTFTTCTRTNNLQNKFP